MPVVAPAPVTAGLSEAEAAARRAARPEPPEPAASRSTAAIVRANTFTPFNAILLALGVLTLTFGDWRDALFLAIIVTNTGIGIWQELRAKQKLDALAAMVAPPSATLRRTSLSVGSPVNHEASQPVRPSAISTTTKVKITRSFDGSQSMPVRGRAAPIP